MHIEVLVKLLDRHTTIDSLGALVTAMSPVMVNGRSISTIAIGLDANVFLKLGSHARREDIVDYLDERHPAPLILPGQAIQEFWNNQLSAIETVSASVKKKFDALRIDAQKIDPNFGEYANEMDGLLLKFGTDYGYVYHESTLRNTLKILELLHRKAISPYVPRQVFQNIAAGRKRTRTPPGFKDEADGDFYIWADFLLGLLLAKEREMAFDHAVMVTQDLKLDWSRSGIAHPVLAAEVRALTGVSFEVWTIEQLYAAIVAEVAEAPQVAAVVPAPT